ncbi:MAG: glycosyltransferase family 2 protein [Acidobacteriaceae bacterium]|nr:glycosyltransferase family 2 protein [Acidobacteriaceae bacterium]
MPRISAIVPTYNRADLVQSILANLKTQTRPPDQVIVIDNGSRDATQMVARESGADLIVFPENRGFAAAVNEGVRQASGDWLLIVNNDVVLEPEWLERLLRAVAEENALFATGKLLQRDDPAKLDGSWDLVSRAAYAWRCGYGKRDGAVWSVRRKMFFPPMTAALFNRQVFERVGLLETRFESYYEDVDFGVRCALAGLEGVYEPAAVAVHAGHTTLGKRGARVLYLSARNQVLLLAKHYPPETVRRFAWPILVGQLLSLMAAAKQGHFFAALRGKWHGLRRWPAFRKQAQRGAAEAIEAAFSESEREIRSLQRQVGFDPYWRLYFSLVRA